MADFFRNFSKIGGGSAIWLEQGPASELLRNEFFDQPPISQTVYVGAAGQAQKYVGLRTEAQLYVGAGDLWP